MLISISSCKKQTNEETVYKDELQENVVLIKEETKSKIIKLNGNTLIVKGTNGYARTIQSTQDFLKIGTVLVCEPLPNIAPDGILGTIIDIQPNTDAQYGAGYNNVTLAPANLEDYIKNTEGNGVNSDKQSFLYEEILPESGVTFNINSTSITLTINKQIQQNFGTQSSVNFKVSGSLKFEKDIKLGMKVRNSKFENFNFEIVNKDVADIKLDGNFELATKKEWQLCKIKGKSIRFLIGSIPVWVKPIFTVKFKVDASGKAGFTFDIIKFEKEYSNRVEYSNGQWKIINVEVPTTFSPLQYQLYLEGKAKLNLEASLEGSFYNGLLSCGVEASLFREMKNRVQNGEPTKCDWVLGADLGVFIKSSIFSKDLVDLTYTPFSWEFKRDIVDLLTTPPTNISNGLVAYYPLNGNVNDESGNNQNGTIMNTPSFATGISGQSIKLTGRCDYGWCEGDLGDHVLIPMPQFNSMNSFSLNIWVKEEALLHSDGSAYLSFGSGHDIYIGHYGNELRFASSGSSIITTPYNTANTNLFKMYTMVYDNGTLKAYQDGILVGTKLNASKSFSGTVAGIARHWSGAGTYTRFSGNIDQVRIYNRTLTSTEISNLYSTQQ